MAAKDCRHCLYHAGYLEPYGKIIHRCKAHNENITDLTNFCELWCAWPYENDLYVGGGKK